MCVTSAAAVNTAKGDLTGVMKQVDIKGGFDVGMEMSGNGRALNQLINSMENGGRIALLGIQNRNSFDLPINTVIWNGLKIKGIYGREMGETWYKMAAMIHGGFNLEPIITHRFDVKDYEKGFEAMNSGKSGKVILDWTKIR
ncbi:MAG: zinc-binding dehydrogenase [Clostridia bacterium]|nr:zinc-binding dehydrogenase [Clostridia bacterium]